MNKVAIWGCGGFGREVQQLCETLGYQVIGFLDERPNMKSTIVNGVQVIGDLNDLESKFGLDGYTVAFGIGDPQTRMRLAQETESRGFNINPALIHPSVEVSAWNTVGRGSIICCGSILTVNITIGQYAIVNLRTNIGHDSKIGDFSTISPGCNISGNVTIGVGAYIGTGASIREKTEVGEWSVVGGSAFVKDNVPSKVLVAGVPAILKKEL